MMNVFTIAWRASLVIRWKWTPLSITNRFDTEKSLFYRSQVSHARLHSPLTDEWCLGNGYLGLSLSSQSQIQLLVDIRSPFLASGYSPIVRITSDTWEDSSASLVQMKRGLVRRIQCFKLSNERSAHLTHLMYAHRTRASLIVQELEMINPSEHTLDLNFEATKPTPKHDMKVLNEQDIQFDTSRETFSMTSNQISPRQHHSILFVIITSKLPSSNHVKPGRSVDDLTYSPVVYLSL